MEKIISLLEKILLNDINSKQYIYLFQKEILETDKVFGNKELDDLLSDLAIDLDYFEPDPELRKEDPSYYSEEVLKNYIEPVFQQINNFINETKKL